MAVKQEPLNNLENEQGLLNSRNNELVTLQGGCRRSRRRDGLLDPSLYQPG